MYQAALSPNLLERPGWINIATVAERCRQNARADNACGKETDTKSIFEAIQTINRNLVCMLELQINAHWATRASHFVMLNARIT